MGSNLSKPKKKPTRFCKECIHGPFNVGCCYDPHCGAYAYSVVCSNPKCEKLVNTGISPAEDFDAVLAEWMPDEIWEHNYDSLKGKLT